MNGYRLTLGLLIAGLCILCMTQISFSGCASAKESDSDTETTRSPFSGTTQQSAFEAPTSWDPVAGSVFAYLTDMYKDYDFQIRSVERGESRTSSIRIVVGSRDGCSDEKQILDAFWILHENFPRMDYYQAVIDRDDDTAIAGYWEDLVQMEEAGYSFNLPDDEAVPMIQFFAVDDIDGGEENPGHGDQPSNAGIVTD
jgi:hypothetical protein